MPKLLQINVTANWGSTGKIAEQIGQKAIDAGWECYLAYGRYRNPSNLKLIKIGNKLSVLWHFVESRLIDNEGLASRIATKKFLKKIDKINPDIVHLHNIHDHWMNYKMLFSYLSEKQIPVVWTMHDQWAISGHCMYIPNGCSGFKNGCAICPIAHSEYPRTLICNSRRNLGKKQSAFSLVRGMSLVSVSNWEANSIHNSILSDCSIRVILNGVDLNLFKSRNLPDVKQRFGLPNEKMILAVSSHWCDRKGFDDYLKLSRMLPDGFFILLVGLTARQIAKLPDGLYGLPKIQNTFDLALLFSSAYIVMSLSRYETFGLTIAEGLACGTPAIVYDNTAQTEIIDEHTGIAVETGNVPKVVDAINNLDQILQTDKDKISLYCRQRAELFFDAEKNTEQYLKLYEELLNQKSNHD